MLTTKLLMLHKINEDHIRAKVVSKYTITKVGKLRQFQKDEEQGKKENKLKFGGTRKKGV